MELKDLFLTPIYLFVIYIIAFLFRNKFYYNKPQYKKYFIPALTVKIISAIALGFLYQFYYKGGDTFNYFTHGSAHIWDALLHEPLKGLHLIFGGANDYTIDSGKYSGKIWFFGDPHSYFIVRISAIFGVFCFHTYTVVGIFFAVITFTGVWKLYITFTKIYPSLYKSFAIAILFMPSVVFWGSGLLKDSITLAALGWLFFAFHRLVIEKKKPYESLLLIAISLFLLIKIKIYILLCFVPAALYWIFNEYNKKIELKVIRMLARPLFVIIALGLGYVFTKNLATLSSQYSLDNIIEKANVTSSYIKRVSDMEGGSSYSLSRQLDGTIGNTVALIPEAITVTLYRPFIWEAKNPVMLMAALESAFVLIFTLLVLYRILVKKLYGIRSKTPPVVIFCLIFSFSFAFAIGVSTFNFGSLVRYKIPLMPFYISALFIYYKIQNQHTIFQKKQ